MISYLFTRARKTWIWFSNFYLRPNFSFCHHVLLQRRSLLSMTFLHQYHVRQIRCLFLKNLILDLQNIFYGSSIICCSGWVLDFEDVAVFIKDHGIFSSNVFSSPFLIYSSYDRSCNKILHTWPNKKWHVNKKIFCLFWILLVFHTYLQKKTVVRYQKYKINSMEFLLFNISCSVLRVLPMFDSIVNTQYLIFFVEMCHYLRVIIFVWFVKSELSYLK